MRCIELSKEHLAICSVHLNLISKLSQSSVSFSGKRKIFPSARPPGGALRTHWHIETQKMYHNFTEQEETEATSDWQVIGLPPASLFPQIFFKPWPLSSSPSLASSHSEKIALPIASLGTEVHWHALHWVLSFPITNFSLCLLSLTSFLKGGLPLPLFPLFRLVVPSPNHTAPSTSNLLALNIKSYSNFSLQKNSQYFLWTLHTPKV